MSKSETKEITITKGVSYTLHSIAQLVQEPYIYFESIHGDEQNSEIVFSPTLDHVNHCFNNLLTDLEDYKCNISYSNDNNTLSVLLRTSKSVEEFNLVTQDKNFMTEVATRLVRIISDPEVRQYFNLNDISLFKNQFQNALCVRALNA